MFLVLTLIILIVTIIFGTPECVMQNSLTKPFEEGVNYWVTSPFGDRIDPFTGEIKFHSGIDLTTEEGTYITSSYEGKVYYVGFQEEGLGEYVIIEHYIEGEKYRTTYGHLQEESIIVEVGEVVTTGQQIWLIGTTGRSTGIHLHFMISIIEGNERTLIDQKFLFE